LRNVPISLLIIHTAKTEKKTEVYKRMGKTETILTDGHHIYTDGTETQVTFYDSPLGKKLKKMWDKLNEQPKRRHYRGLKK